MLDQDLFLRIFENAISCLGQSRKRYREWNLKREKDTLLLRLWFSIDVRKDLNILETQTKPADQTLEPVIDTHTQTHYLNVISGKP